MESIVSHKRSCVFYSHQNHTFIKTFSPKFINRFKFFLGLRRYPGNNFFYISNLLNSLNIKTPEIVTYSKYKVITKDLYGESLEKYLENSVETSSIINRYVEIILILLKNDIYSGDLSLDNFFVKNDEIYALDLEDYKHNICFKNKKNKIIERLKNKIPSSIFNLILEEIKK
ncbi:MAG: RIO1 family regulatory kinase/ATPase [Fusobacteriaceae bacterium]